METATRATAHRSTVLIITTIASFLVPFMTSSITVALPAIGSAYSMNVITLGWVSTAYMLASASLLVPFGKIADMYGRRRIFVLGVFVFTVGSALSAVSVSGPMLLISRAVQGVGGAAQFSTAIAILTSAYLGAERGRVLGINTASVYLGLSLGPVLGGVITETMGWQSIFTISSALSVIVFIVTLWRLKGETVEAKREKFDLPGSGIYAVALVLIMYGVSLLPAGNSIWLIGGGAVAAGLFVWWETKSGTPMLDLHMFRRNRAFTFSNLAALVNYSGTWAVAFLMSLYLQYVRGLDPEAAGLVLISSPAVQAILSPLAGRLSDRMEPRLLASAGMAMTGAAIGMLAFITATTSEVYIIVCLVMLGFGFALFSSPNTNAVMSSADHSHYGIASATLATMRQMGMMVSMGIVWIVFGLVIGRVEITPEYYPALVKSVRLAFLISAGLCFAAIYFSMARGNIHETAERPVRERDRAR